MAFPSSLHQYCVEVISGLPSGLDGVAVRAQRDHLDGVITATIRDLFDMINFQDGIATIRDVRSKASTSRILTPALTAQQDRTASRTKPNRIVGY